MAVLETQTPTEPTEALQAADSRFFVAGPEAELHKLSERFMLQQDEWMKAEVGVVFQHTPYAIPQDDGTTEKVRYWSVDSQGGVESQNQTVYFDKRRRSAGEFSWRIIYGSPSGRETRIITVTSNGANAERVTQNSQGHTTGRESSSDRPELIPLTASWVVGMLASEGFSRHLENLAQEKKDAESVIEQFIQQNAGKLHPKKFNKELKRLSENSEKIGFTPIVPENTNDLPDRSATYDEVLLEIKLRSKTTG